MTFLAMFAIQRWPRWRWAVLSLVGLLALAGTVHAAPIRTLPGLLSITFYEASGGPVQPKIFLNPATDSRLLNRLFGPLDSSNNDFLGIPNEYYDVFYSDANGNPNIDGECLTIEAEFSPSPPPFGGLGGGLNIAEVELKFADGSSSYMCRLASAVYLGSTTDPAGRPVPGSADFAVDGNLSTATSMGNTTGQPAGTRLRITLCSPCAVTFDPCCPPWSSHRLAELMVYQGTGGISAPFSLLYQPTPAFDAAMTAYSAYVNAVNPAILGTFIQFSLHDGGTGQTCNVNGPQIDGNIFRAWTPSGPFSSIFTNSNFPPASMEVNRWYLIHSTISLVGGTFFPDSCKDNDICVRLQVQTLDAAPVAGGSAESAVLQIRTKDGSVIERSLPARTP